MPASPYALALRRCCSISFSGFAVLVATLVVASLVVFAVMDILPGNAAETMLGPTATPEAVAALAHKLGIDLPLHVRYAQWIARTPARRSRPLLRLRLADRAADRREPRGQPAARRHGDGAFGGDRARGRRLRRRSARARRRRGRDGRDANRPRRAEFLAGDPDGDRLRRHAEARARGRLSRLGVPRAGRSAR